MKFHGAPGDLFLHNRAHYIDTSLDADEIDCVGDGSFLLLADVVLVLRPALFHFRHSMNCWRREIRIVKVMFLSSFGGKFTFV